MNLLKIAIALWLFAGAVVAGEQINITFITLTPPIQPALSNLDEFIPEKGLLGAQLAVADNNTTGQFTGHKYLLHKIIVPVDGDVLAAFNSARHASSTFVIANLPPKQLQLLAKDSGDKGILIFDAGTRDDEFRKLCQPNILHILPSNAMAADALGQYLAYKKWKKWFLVSGTAPADRAFATAVRRAAKRFGAQIVASREWTHTFDARRSAQQVVPVFTQGVRYDVLVLADVQGLFGEYFAYRTWLARPVVGTQGLVATSWHRTHEQWGAVQMQNRFRKSSGRWMLPEDYAAYLAARSIGEAVTRSQSIHTQTVKNYLLSSDFALQGYKGKPLSFRAWNGQLRQPILLASPRSIVATPPLDGYLHPTTSLDTLGYPHQPCTTPQKQ